MKKATEQIIVEIKDRQPHLGGWLEEFFDLYKKEVVSDEEFQNLGHGLIIEEPDKDLLFKWLEHFFESLGRKFSVIDLDEAMDSLDRLSGISNIFDCVYLKSGDWLKASDNSETSRLTRQKVIDFLRAPKNRCVLVSDLEEYIWVAEELCYEGLFDRAFRWFIYTNPELIGSDFIDSMGKSYFADEVIKNPTRLGRLLDVSCPQYRSQGLFRSALKRAWAIKKRPLTWSDIIQEDCSSLIKGSFTSDVENMRQVAIHEAGHALMEITCTSGGSVPELISLSANSTSVGKTYVDVDLMYEHWNRKLASVSDIFRAIKIILGGRIAEEIILGFEEVGVEGASGDLREASKVAYDLIARQGFSCDYGLTNDGGKNLFIFSGDVPDYVKGLQEIELQNEARKLLHRLYSQGKTELENRRNDIELLATTLLARGALTREQIIDVLGLSGSEVLE